MPALPGRVRFVEFFMLFRGETFYASWRSRIPSHLFEFSTNFASHGPMPVI